MYKYLIFFPTLLLCLPCHLDAQEGIQPGSSLENESDVDWSERDNVREGPSGSSYEKQNPAREPLPPRAVERPVQPDITIKKAPDIMVLPSEQDITIDQDAVTRPDASPATVQQTPAGKPASEAPSESDVEVIWRGTQAGGS